MSYEGDTINWGIEGDCLVFFNDLGQKSSMFLPLFNVQELIYELIDYNMSVEISAGRQKISTPFNSPSMKLDLRTLGCNHEWADTGMVWSFCKKCNEDRPRDA